MKRKLRLAYWKTIMLMLFVTLGQDALSRANKDGLKPKVDFEYRTEADKKYLDLTWSEPVKVKSIKLMGISGDDLGEISWDGKASNTMTLDVTDLPGASPMYTFVLSSGQEWSYTFKANRKKKD